MSKKEVHIINNILEVKPLEKDLKIKEYGVIYVYESEGLYYKLHSFNCKVEEFKIRNRNKPTDEFIKRYFWIMMNNSSGIEGDFKNNYEFKSIEDAVRERIDKGFKVYEMTMKSFCHI